MLRALRSVRSRARCVAAVLCTFTVCGSLLAAPSTGEAAGTTRLPNFAQVRMLNATDGWASAAGQVLATSDGGATWVPETGPGQGAGSLIVPAWGSQGCRAISCTPVFVTTQGANGVGIDLAVSRDGGTSWTDLHQTGLLAPVDVVSMTPLWTGGDEFSFPTPQDGWALWFAATPDAEVIIFHSQDGGRRWVPAGYLSMSSGFPGSPPPSGAPADLTFASPSTGWITGVSYGEAWLYATTDGGRTWRNVDLPIPANYADWQVVTSPPLFSSSKDGVLPVSFSAQLWVGGQCRERAAVLLYGTTDGGETWVPTTPHAMLTQPVPQGTPAWSILDPSHVWAVGQGAVVSTSDGGSTWQSVPTNLPVAMANHLQFVSVSVGFAVAYSGNSTVVWATHDGGRIWQPTASSVECPGGSATRGVPGC